ncbi:MAG: hypothetical protein ACRD6W_10040, partial [Nitrososphaerales archaeon]
LLPYAILAAGGARTLGQRRAPQRVQRWLARAVAEEELELAQAIHPRRGRPRDGVVAAGALVVVVAASVAVERTASRLGTRWGVPDVIVGGLVLAVVTSLPNLVAAIYLARRGRGAATLSTALNSNALNVAVGFLLPAVILGLGPTSHYDVLVGAWYLGFTVMVILFARLEGGVTRATGALIVASYLGFTAVVLIVGIRGHLGPETIAVPGIAIVTAAAVLILVRGRRRSRPAPGPIDLPPSVGNIGTALEDRPSPNGMRPGLRSQLGRWPTWRFELLAIVLSSSVAATDAALGHRVVLIGALIVGPCCALLTGKWSRTALVAGWAVVLAIVLGLPDGIWIRPEHLVFVGAVFFVGLVTTAAAFLIERSG